MPRREFGVAERLRITRGALIVAGLEIGLSLVWLLSNPDARQAIAEWIVPTADNVFHHGRVWTLLTGAFLEPNFIGLILHAVVLWGFVPVLERFWGTTRFYRFVAITSIVGTLAGTLVGLAIGRDGVPIAGLNPFVYASIVAFGIIYARHPVQFFGVLPLTGRQLMWGFVGFLALFVLLQGKWEEGAAFSAAMLAAALMTSKRWSPAIAWKRWRIARARARLSVIDGGVPKATAKKKSDERFIN